MSHKKRKFEADEERNLHHVFAAAAKVRVSSIHTDKLREIPPCVLETAKVRSDTAILVIGQGVF